MAVSRLTQTTLQNGFEKFNRIWDERSAVGSMEAISAVTLSAAQASVEFNNIPGTYSHLQLRIMSLGSADVAQSLSAKYNGDTGSNYSSHWIYGDGSNVGAGSTANDSIQYFGFSLFSTNPNSSIVDILDYSNTNKFKTMRCFTGSDRNGSGSIWLFSGSWRNTNAITSITITPNSGSFNTNSAFSLYGIK